MNVCGKIKTVLSSVWDARKLSVLALCSVLVMGTTTTGCTSAQVASTIKNIAIYAQEAQPIITQVISLITAFSATDSSTSSKVTDVQTVGKKIQSDLADLVSLCNSYTAKPSTTVWGQIITLVDDLVTNGDTALTDLAGIKSSSSQQSAMVVLASLSALLHTIDGLVQSTQTSSQVKATAQRRTIKLRTVSSYWSDDDKSRIAQAFDSNYPTLYGHEISMGF